VALSRDRMVVGFITTYAISSYHHKRCEFEPHSGEVYMYSIQQYVIKFVSDLRQVGGFLRVRPKIRIGLFAVGQPTLQNWGRPKFVYCSCDNFFFFFFRFAFAVNPDLYFSGLIRILLYLKCQHFTEY